MLPALSDRLRVARADRHNHRQLRRLTRAVGEHSRPDPNLAPVVVFRASTGLLRLSLNAAFSLLSAWALRLAGAPVVHFTCHAGMSRCVQGVNRQNYAQEPPCRPCIAQAQRTYAGARIRWFDLAIDERLARQMQGLSMEALATVEAAGLPLGKLVLPSLRWTLRRHHLPDDEPTRFLMRHFVLSAARVGHEFEHVLEHTRPQAVLLFNGMFFPEAVVRRLAGRHGLPVISHEVGFRAHSAFFTTGEATAYPMDLPAGWTLTPAQNARLNAYLGQRFQGEFTMAGIRFWPEMRGLDPGLVEAIGRFRQMVPVFTNVVYDTSQVHANTLFPHMFAWLEEMLAVMRAYPDTLFVIRAHPDESRPGKVSQESVTDWVAQGGVAALPNVVFVGPDEYLSSYELIQRAKFVVVYNSSIGLEAALLGASVVCGGKARYTQASIAHLPESRDAFRRQVESLLEADEVHTPAAFQEEARRFLYHQLYRVSLPFEAYLEEHPMPGFVRLRDFDWQALAPERSPTIRTVVEGILEGKPFVLPEHNEVPDR